MYLGSWKLDSINKKRVLIKLIINTADIFTQTYTEDAAECDDINFVKLNFSKLSYLTNIVLQYLYAKQDAVWERNV